jgi:hypothetical protein
MSLRALGRQFKAQLANQGRPWIAGTEAHPQGRLFDPRQLPGRGIFDPDVKESARRRTAGENNPAAPWTTPLLQHHFLKHPEPVQGEL